MLTEDDNQPTRRGELQGGWLGHLWRRPPREGEDPAGWASAGPASGGGGSGGPAGRGGLAQTWAPRRGPSRRVRAGSGVPSAAPPRETKGRRLPRSQGRRGPGAPGAGWPRRLPGPPDPAGPAWAAGPCATRGGLFRGTLTPSSRGGGGSSSRSRSSGSGHLSLRLPLRESPQRGGREAPGRRRRDRRRGRHLAPRGRRRHGHGNAPRPGRGLLEGVGPGARGDAHWLHRLVGGGAFRGAGAAGCLGTLIGRLEQGVGPRMGGVTRSRVVAELRPEHRGGRDRRWAGAEGRGLGGGGPRAEPGFLALSLR